MIKSKLKSKIKSQVLHNPANLFFKNEVWVSYKGKQLLSDSNGNIGQIKETMVQKKVKAFRSESAANEYKNYIEKLEEFKGENDDITN